MNPSYFRINIPKDEALRRFAEWIGLPAVGPLVEADSSTAIRLALDERGMWRGNAVLVSEISGWTLFQDLSGGLGAIPASRWRDLAQQDELVFAGYNDSIPYGELVVIRDGYVLREFFDDRDDASRNVNVGRLENETVPFTTWVDAAGFVDEDRLGFSDSGWLWVYSERADRDAK